MNTYKKKSLEPKKKGRKKHEMNTKEASMWVLIGGVDESCVRVCGERDGQRKKMRCQIK